MSPIFTLRVFINNVRPRPLATFGRARFLKRRSQSWSRWIWFLWFHRFHILTGKAAAPSSHMLQYGDAPLLECFVGLQQEPFGALPNRPQILSRNLVQPDHPRFRWQPWGCRREGQRRRKLVLYTNKIQWFIWDKRHFLFFSKIELSHYPFNHVLTNSI